MERSDGVDISPHCQRCGSTNTKFCYYNNYSLTQPRYFCKGCRRYWTKGGSLRNVPVGGGCRKTRRGRAISISRYHHSSPSNGPLGCTSPDANCITGYSKFGSVGHWSAPSIDLAAVYANFLKQEPQPAKGSTEDHDNSNIREVVTSNSQPCSSTLKCQLEDRTIGSMTNCVELGDLAARIDESPFELPPLPNEEGLLFSHAADWFGSQLVGSNEDPSVHILAEEISQENCDINQLVDSWSPFDFPI